MLKTVSNNQAVKQAYSTISVVLVIFLLLFFRNPLAFTYPVPWSEDFSIFIRDEYNVGFPDTAFHIYAGYIHLLPRIITWISMTFGLQDAMRIMNWTVLLLKILTFYYIYKSKEISSNIIKFSLLTYLILVPFSVEIYNNVTNLQWWLIPLMGIILVRHESNSAVFIFDVCLLTLCGLTGVNSVMFALPCVYLMLRVKNRECLVKCLTVIICACVQFYFLYTSGRNADIKIMYNGGGIDILNLFVNRVIYHTLFNFSSESYINIFIVFLYFSILTFNIYYYRKSVVIQFIFLFSLVYTAAVFYNFIKWTPAFNNYLLYGFWSERYFVYLRICSFVLLISSLNILLKPLACHRSYRRLMAYSCFLLCLIILKNYSVSSSFHWQFYDTEKYPISILSNSQYYDDIKQFQSAKTGEMVRFHYDASPFSRCDLPLPAGAGCYMQKK